MILISSSWIDYIMRYNLNKALGSLQKLQARAKQFYKLKYILKHQAVFHVCKMI